MATLTQTTDLARFFYGEESVYTGASTTDKATFDKGIYICTDTGRLYMHGTEVRDTNALTSVANYNISELTYTASSRVLTVKQSNGTTKTATLPDVATIATSSNPAEYGVISGSLLNAISQTASDNATAAANAAAAAKTAQSGVDAINSAKGKASGFASLDSDGKVPSSQLPSYVDDVLEYDYKDSTEKGSATSGTTFPATGETGKIYVSKATNLTYRWGGTTYVEISPSLALGETSSTAFAGDRGKALEDAWDDFNENQRVTGISYDDSTHTLSLDVPDGSSVTLGTDTIPTATTTTDGLLSKSDKSAYDTAKTNLGGTSDTASATGSAFARIAQNKADIATAIKTIGNGVSGATTVTMTTTTVGGTTGTVTIPEASSSGSGTAGVVSGATAKAIVSNTARRVKAIGNTPAADAVTVTVDLNTATDVSTSLPSATTSAAGVMSAADKTNLDALVAVSVWYAAT